MRKPLIVLSLAGLVFAGTAAAASGPNISISLHPDKVKKNSTLSVDANGFPAENSLPTSLALQVQKGFRTSTKAVKQLCNPSASSCPAASKIGTVIVQATGSLAGASVTHSIDFTIYLGKPERSGDIASVIVSGRDTLLNQTLSGSGRLFKDSTGGLELLFDKFPSIQGLPPGTQITLDSLSLTAGAKRTVKKTTRVHHKKVTVKTTYSLVTNPSRCRGHWSATATVIFPGSALSQALNIPCTK